MLLYDISAIISSIKYKKINILYNKKKIIYHDIGDVSMIKKSKRIILILILVFVFIFMYLLNMKTMMVSDDYIYHFVFTGRTPTSSTHLVSNPIEIFTSMVNHWHLWGGRVSLHYLLQFTFMFDINIFNIVNSVMFVILGILIYKHATKSKDNILLIIFIYAMLFLFMPQPGSTIMWKSGSANYLWSSVLILSMTLIYKNHHDGYKIKDNVINNILIFILGLIVGCCNENSGCALILAECLFIFLYYFKYQKVPVWAIMGLIATIISYVILIIAPGNYIRAEVMYPAKDYSLNGIFKQFLTLTNLSYNYLKITIIITIITFILTMSKIKEKKDFIKKYSVQLVFILFTICSIYSLIVSPAYPERCFVFGFIYLLVIISMNIINFDKNLKLKKLLIIFTIVICLSSFSEYSMAYIQIDNSNRQLKEQLSQIQEQKSQGKRDIVVHNIIDHVGKYNAFTDNGYLTSNKDSWFNKWMAKYYEVDSIIAID